MARTLHSDLDRSESFVTLFQCAIDVASGDLRYVDAGAGLCIVVRSDGSVERLAGDDRPLGILEDDLWTQHRARLEPGDRLLVFSDGLFDLLEDQAEWSTEVGATGAGPRRPHPAFAGGLAGGPPHASLDDVTAVAVYRLPEDGR